MERGRGGRELEGKGGQARERERERGGRAAAQWPVVSVGLYGPVGAAARAVAGVCSAHLLKHRHKHRQWHRRRHMEYTCTQGAGMLVGSNTRGFNVIEDAWRLMNAVRDTEHDIVEELLGKCLAQWKLQYLEDEIWEIVSVLNQRLAEVGAACTERMLMAGEAPFSRIGQFLIRSMGYGALARLVNALWSIHAKFSNSFTEAHVRRTLRYFKLSSIVVGEVMELFNE